jgi:hypothetical protein
VDPTSLILINYNSQSNRDDKKQHFTKARPMQAIGSREDKNKGPSKKS